MDENVRIDLTSRADVSGFREMETASLQFNAAKREGAKANDVLVESERRVRSNLVETVAGLAQARSGTEAVASSVTHLSEIFKIGLGGTVIAGVVGAIVEQFAKAQAAIEETGKSLLATGEQADALLEKLKGIQDNGAGAAKRDIAKQEEELAKAQQSDSGFMSNLIRGINRVSGGALFEDSAEQLDKNRANAASLQAKITQEGLLAGNPGSFDRDKRAEEAKRDAAEKERVQEDFYRQAMDSEKREDEESPRQLAENKRQADEQARVKAEADKRAQEQAAEKARAAARAEATEQRADEREAKKEGQADKPGRIRADIVAGGSRQMGGGGGVFSAVTADPAVLEARKQTSLQQEILGALRSTQSNSARGRVALAA